MVCLNNGHVVLQEGSEIYEYDITKNTWYAVCANEVPVRNFTLAVYQSRLLLVSGKIWHLRDDKCGWIESPLSPVPSSNSYIASVAVDGDLLVVASSAKFIGTKLDVDTFDGKAWKPTVHIQEKSFMPSSLYISDGHLYLLCHMTPVYGSRVSGAGLETESIRLWNHDFIGSVPIDSLLEATADDRCVAWKELYIAECISNPVSCDGHFISLAIISKQLSICVCL